MDKISQPQDQLKHLNPEDVQDSKLINHINLENVTRKAAEAATTIMIAELDIAAHFLQHPETLPEDLKEKIHQAKVKLATVIPKNHPEKTHPEELARTAIKSQN